MVISEIQIEQAAVRSLTREWEGAMAMMDEYYRRKAAYERKYGKVLRPETRGRKRG